MCSAAGWRATLRAKAVNATLPDLRCQMQRVVGTLHASPVALGAIVDVFLRRWSALAHAPTVTVRCRAPQLCRIQAFPAFSAPVGRAP